MTRHDVDPEAERFLARMREDGLLEDPDAILDAVEAPDWQASRGVHDWRNYVPPSIREAWPSLPLVTRLCIYETTELVALAEQVGDPMVTGPHA